MRFKVFVGSSDKGLTVFVMFQIRLSENNAPFYTAVGHMFGCMRLRQLSFSILHTTTSMNDFMDERLPESMCYNPHFCAHGTVHVKILGRHYDADGGYDGRPLTLPASVAIQGR